MADLNTTIVEIPGIVNPPDLANVIAILSWYPGLTVSPAQIPYAQRVGDVKALGLWGKGADLGSHALRVANDRGNPATVYFVPMPAENGSVVDNGASGFGPTQTLAPAGVESYPYDDATVVVRIRETGIPGVGTFELSTASSVTRNPAGSAPTIAPLFLAPRTIPPETQAQLIGTEDITQLSFAKAASVTGQTNLVTTSALYGAGGTLAGTSFGIDVDGNATITVTFGSGINAPQSYASVIATIGTALGSLGSAAITSDGKLIIRGVKVSAADGEIVITPGTATTPLGLSGGTTTGTNGTLDGLTIIYTGDATSGSQTYTAPEDELALTSPEALISALGALTGVDASMYTAKHLLRIGSSTYGSASTFSITGGTALSVLGLSAQSATGAASEVLIEHLGLQLTFPQGSYQSGYTRTWTVTAPRHSIADVQTAIDAMVAQDIRVGRIVCPSYVPLQDVAGYIQGFASKIGELEASNDARFAHAVFGAPIDEADLDVKSAMVSGVANTVAVGRRVDMAARTAYVRPSRSTPNQTGSLLRSQLWPLVGQYASLPLGSDVGQHNVGALPYVDYVPVDEDAATVKLSALRDITQDPRAITAQKFGGLYHFTAGFTLAPSVSAYADQYTRDITLRVAQLAHAAAQVFMNDPTLATSPSTGKLTDNGRASVTSSIASAVGILVAPQSATEEEKRQFPVTQFSVSVDQNEVISGPSGTQRLKVDVVFVVRGVARRVSITVGAGLIEVNEQQG